MSWYKKANSEKDLVAIRELISFKPNVPIVFQLHTIAEAIIDKVVKVNFPNAFDNESLNKQTIINDVAVKLGKYFTGREKPVSDELLVDIVKYLERIEYFISIEPKFKA